MAKQALYGIHAIQSVLQTTPEHITQLYVNKGRSSQRIEAILTIAEQQHIPIRWLDKQSFAERAPEAVHQGIMADYAGDLRFAEQDIPHLVEAAGHETLVLILDGVQDPHNLGACLRSADAAGVTLVIAPKDKSASLTPTVRKVACGAAEQVPFIAVTNLARTMRQLQDLGVWCYGLAGEAQDNLYHADLKGPVAIVMGAEGKGLRRLTREHCDGLFSIPMQGSVSSLNVSVATGISLFEVLRQREG